MKKNTKIKIVESDPIESIVSVFSAPRSSVKDGNTAVYLDVATSSTKRVGTKTFTGHEVLEISCFDGHAISARDLKVGTEIFLIWTEIRAVGQKDPAPRYLKAKAIMV